MMKCCVWRLKKAGDEITPAALRTVIDATTDNEIGVVVGPDHLGEAAKMIRRPNVVMPEVTDPVSARGPYPLVIRQALAASVCRQIAPNDLVVSERPDNRFGFIGAAVANDDQFKIRVRLPKNSTQWLV